MSLQGTVFVIDDDPLGRNSLATLIESFGYQAECYESGDHFLASGIHDSGCIVSDFQMPGMTGIELQERLAEIGSVLPFIIVSGQITPALAHRAVENGVLAVIEKPYRDQQLWDAIKQGLASHA